MLTVFIDTNVYKKLNFNFDERNSIFKSFIDMIKKEEVKNIIISVIDNEIIMHLNRRLEENRKGIKKYCKWISNVISNEIIEENLKKELKDYERFKRDSLSEVIELKDVNPENVLNKYFNRIPPFEDSKQNEFKDAFFIEGILKYAEDNCLNEFAVITMDKGVKKAFLCMKNNNVKILDSIQELIDIISNYGKEKKNEVLNYISSFNLKPLIEEKICLNSWELEEEIIEVDDISIMGIYNLDILENNNNNLIVGCDIGISLKGEFSCLDYENSYYSSEESDYVYKEYIEKNNLMYVCDTILEIKKANMRYNDIKIKDFPDINIEYEDMKGREEYM